MGISGLGIQCGQNLYPQARYPCPKGPPHPLWTQAELRKMTSGRREFIPCPVSLHSIPNCPWGPGRRQGRRHWCSPTKARGLLSQISHEKALTTASTVIRPGQNQQRKMPQQGWANTLTPSLHSVQSLARPLPLLIQAGEIALTSQAYL